MTKRMRTEKGWKENMNDSDLSVAVSNLMSELKNCRNELCLKCGRYKEAHNGACDDCRYRHGGEWSVDLDEW